MTPHIDQSTAYYEFEGTGTLAGLLAGVVPHKLAFPSVPSWNTIHTWLRELALLEGTLDPFAL